MKFSSIACQSSAKIIPPTSPLILLFLLCSFFSATTSLHLQAQPVDQANVYNKNLYMDELSSVQSRLSKGLQAIKDKFTLMNQ